MVKLDLGNNNWQAVRRHSSRDETYCGNHYPTTIEQRIPGINNNTYRFTACPNCGTRY